MSNQPIVQAFYLKENVLDTNSNVIRLWKQPHFEHVPSSI